MTWLRLLLTVTVAIQFFLYSNVYYAVPILLCLTSVLVNQLTTALLLQSDTDCIVSTAF